ncbi:hypothetical protein GMST_30550 [Geomonas silvestris]|uniref:Uncharacterized protein n=1 Tax=Geomonas silvestris TaxID=2740184 RepID=A0A6V8ML33_9BACT|nr:hypothetical protein [Geomonas silvestris]GFO60730.1 hypothetical protein GMST_30550 [Geomonas silvestris]
MQIGPGLGVAIMMNNYFHDMATGLLVGSGFALHAIIQIQRVMNTPEATLFFLKTNQKMVKLFKFALWWVVLGGVPRTIFYTSFEWANAADKLQIPALAVKHVMMFAAVVWGVIAWRRMQKKVAVLKESLPEEYRARLAE